MVFRKGLRSPSILSESSSHGTDGILVTSRYVALFNDAGKYFSEVYGQLILGAVVIYAPGLARYVHMVYRCAPWLIAGQHLIRFLQGTQQGNPLGIYLLSLDI